MTEATGGIWIVREAIVPEIQSDNGMYVAGMTCRPAGGALKNPHPYRDEARANAKLIVIAVNDLRRRASEGDEYAKGLIIEAAR